jgi:hypothetical protein
MLLPWLQVNEK